MILLLDTSTADCHLVVCDGDETIIDDVWHADRELAEKIFGYIEKKLAERQKSWDDISGIGIFKGPGSFTGLRIGASVCNALAADRTIAIVGTTGEKWALEALGRLRAGEDDKLVLPEYGRSARITAPRK